MAWAEQFKTDFEDVAERAELLGAHLATVHALGVMGDFNTAGKRINSTGFIRNTENIPSGRL